MKQNDRRKLEIFELWCWRKLLHIPWTAKVTNREVLKCIKPESSLEGKITKLRMSYFDHIICANSLEKTIMLGMASTTRRKGCQRTRWLDTIKCDTNLNIVQLKDKVLAKNAWRKLAYDIGKGRSLLNG